MTSIVTKTGDAGMTGIIGGKRLSKTNPCFHACGTVDELNALIGVTLAEEHVPLHIREQLECTQHLLFQIGADLATPLESGFTLERMRPSQIEIVEKGGFYTQKKLPPPPPLPPPPGPPPPPPPPPRPRRFKRKKGGGGGNFSGVDKPPLSHD